MAAALYLVAIAKLLKEVISMENIIAYRRKQPSRGVLRKRCSEIMRQIYRRTHMPMCDFNKAVLQLY